jgi:hypothetical protein
MIVSKGLGESARALAPIGRHKCSQQKPDRASETREKAMRRKDETFCRFPTYLTALEDCNFQF